ncbi:hypothetical protein NP493_226g02026 [Ridgeia piscesae]|uniref:Uncharacterized protein n=1 Tax=Ridgeia piscesae TaxID=27915 RepID=A0AAD9P037_RIDPI|nr:hypothetical protein NP493_226g02026 [Ridgeia piscesae]
MYLCFLSNRTQYITKAITSRDYICCHMNSCKQIYLTDRNGDIRSNLINVILI